MTRIVDQLPFFTQRSVMTVGNEQIPVKADQIILWLSLTVSEGNFSITLGDRAIDCLALARITHTHTNSGSPNQAY